MSLRSHNEVFAVIGFTDWSTWMIVADLYYTIYNITSLLRLLELSGRLDTAGLFITKWHRRRNIISYSSTCCMERIAGSGGDQMTTGG